MEKYLFADALEHILLLDVKSIKKNNHKHQPARWTTWADQNKIWAIYDAFTSAPLRRAAAGVLHKNEHFPEAYKCRHY